MKNFFWLLKRELWEHKNEFIWAPLLVGGILVVTVGAWAFSKIALGSPISIYVNGIELAFDSKALTPQLQSLIQTGVAVGLHLLVYLLCGLSGFVVFNYCLGSLYDDRIDRSVLFWKSLPVTDTETVMSKVATALLVSPLITLFIVVATMLSIYILIGAVFASAGHGAWFWSNAGSQVAQVLAHLLLVYPLQILWALPTVGWLLLVSSFARSRPMVWAIGIPTILGAAFFALSAAFNPELSDSVSSSPWRTLIGTIPTSWQLLNKTTLQEEGGLWEYFWSLTSTLDSQGIWAGVLAGMVMIWFAIRARRGSGDI